MSSGALNTLQGLSKVGKTKSSIMKMQIFMQLGAFLIYFWGGFTILFIFSRIVPGNPFSSPGGKINPQMMAAMQADLGLNDGLLTQYFKYLKAFIIGDWGQTITLAPGMPVGEYIVSKFWVSWNIFFLALVLSLPIAIPLGIKAANKKQELPDRLITTYANFLFAIPVLLFGVVLKYLFANKLSIFSSSSYASNFTKVYLQSQGSSFPFIRVLFSGHLAYPLDILKHIFLPSLCLSMIFTALLIPVIRDRKIRKSHNVKMGYIDHSSSILFNFSIIFLSFLVIEYLFNLDGMFRLVFNAINNCDYFLITGLGNFFLLGIVAIILGVNLTNIIRYRYVPEVGENADEPLLGRGQSTFIKYNRVKATGTPLISGLKNPFTILGLVVLMGLFVWSIIIFRTTNIPELLQISPLEYQPPNNEHIFGTGRDGQDIYKATLVGVRNLFLIIIVTSVIGSFLGLPLGYGLARAPKVLKNIIIILTNIFLIIPAILVLSFIMSTEDYGTPVTEYIIVALINIVIIAHLSRILFEQILMSYEEMPPVSKVIKQGIPGVLSLVFLYMAWLAVLISGLDFFGYAPNTMISLGYLLTSNIAWSYTAPWAVLYPGLFLFLIGLSFSLISIGFRFQKRIADEIEPTII